MTEERIAQIEAAIAALGEGYSQRKVYQMVGGGHSQLQAYLRAREATMPDAPSRRSRAPVNTAVVVQAMPQQAPTSLMEDLLAAQDAEQAAEARLAELESRASSDMLSESEEIESVRLERRVRNLAAVITRLETEIAQAKETLDIDAFKAAWDPEAVAKQEDYRAFWQAVWALFQARDRIKARTGRQVTLCMDTPPKLQAYLLQTFLPDANTIIARLAQQLGHGWQDILCAPGPTRVATPEHLMANDPGVKALPPRLIQNALNQGRPIERSA